MPTHISAVGGKKIIDLGLFEGNAVKNLSYISWLTTDVKVSYFMHISSQNCESGLICMTKANQEKFQTWLTLKFWSILAWRKAVKHQTSILWQNSECTYIPEQKRGLKMWIIHQIWRFPLIIIRIQLSNLKSK